MKEWPFHALGDACSSLLGWACVIAVTLVLGFCAGYWIGHREITGASQTLGALARVPLLWWGFPQVLVAYLVTAIAWYLPPHYESRWLRIASAAATFLVWALVVHYIVVRTANGKYFRY